MDYYCNVCREPISDKVYEYSMKNYGKALCIPHQKTFVAPSQGLFCSLCNQEISERIRDYSVKNFGKALCINHQKITTSSANSSKITPQAKKLSAALTRNGIKHKMEAYDGHKHVDISIAWAKLNIEIDGRQHLLNSKQLYADVKRDSHSHEDDIYTIRVTNEAVDRDAERIAQAIAKVARRKYRENEDEFDIFSQLASDISSLFSDFLS